VGGSPLDDRAVDELLLVGGGGTGLGHGAGHVEDQQELEDRQAGQHTEPELLVEEGQPEGDDGHDAQAAERVGGQGALRVVGAGGGHLVDRGAGQAVVDRAQGQADAGAHAHPQVAERERRHQGDGADQERGGHGPAGHLADVGELEVGEHG
jgi:hypothetical protein